MPAAPGALRRDLQAALDLSNPARYRMPQVPKASSPVCVGSIVNVYGIGFTTVYEACNFAGTPNAFCSRAGEMRR